MDHIVSVSPNEFAAAALTARIVAGDIARCSGRAQDFQRETARKVQDLLDVPQSWSRGPVTLRWCPWDQNWRGTIDNDRGYWDHVVPTSAAVKWLEAQPTL